jgi:hypothetical protein
MQHCGIHNICLLIKYSEKRKIIILAAAVYTICEYFEGKGLSIIKRTICWRVQKEYTEMKQRRRRMSSVFVACLSWLAIKES